MKRIKLLYISDLILEVENKLYHGIFDIEKFVHDKCLKYDIMAAEKEIMDIVNMCNIEVNDTV